MKRLSNEIKKFILYTNASYPTIVRKIEEKFGQKISKSTVSYYRGKRCGRIKRLNFSKLNNVEFAYLAGLFFADGCAYSKRSGEYSIAFSFSSQNDGDIIKYAVNRLTEINARPSMRVNSGETQIRVFSKEFYHAISCFRQSDFVRSFLCEHTLVEKLAFAGGLVDGDGNVRRRRKNISIEFFQIKYDWIIPLFYNLFSELLGPNSVSIWRDGSSVYIKTNGVKSLLARNLVFSLKLSNIAKQECLLMQNYPELTCGAGEEIRTPESPMATGS